MVYCRYGVCLSIKWPPCAVYSEIFSLLRLQLFNMQDLDTLDIEILKLVQRDAELTNKEISFKLHKSIATIHERVRRLKRPGYIKRTVAILNGKKLNLGLTAFSASVAA